MPIALRHEPKDAMYRTLAEAVALARRERRDDVALAPLRALALRCREISTRAGRYLGVQAAILPRCATLGDLVEEWRMSYAGGERSQHSPRLVARALSALLERPAVSLPNVDDATAAALYGFARRQGLDDVLDAHLARLEDWIDPGSLPLPRDAQTLRAACAAGAEWRRLVGAALRAEAMIRRAVAEASPRRVTCAGELSVERRAACDALWQLAEDIAPFDGATVWEFPAYAHLELDEQGLRFTELDDEDERWSAPAVAVVRISPRGVSADGPDATRERALRIAHDIIDEPEGREADHVRAWLLPKHHLILEALAALAAPSEPAREERVCWLVERQRYGGSYAVSAVIQKALKRGGGFTKGSRAPYREILHGSHGSEQDAAVARALASRGGAGLDADALRLLVGHPWVFVDDDRERPWRIEEQALTVAFRDVEGGYAVALEAGGVALDPGDLPFGYGSLQRTSIAAFDEVEHRIVVADIAPPVRELADALRRSGAFVPAEAKEALVAAIDKAGAAPLSLPPSLEGERRPADPRIFARLVIDERAPLTVRFGVRPAPHGALVPPGSGEAAFVGILDQRRTIFDRDLDDERARAGLVRDDLLAAVETPVELVDDWTLRADGDDAALALVIALEALRANERVVVEWKDPKRALRVAGEGTAAALRVRVRGVESWLGVDGEIEVAGHVVSLALLLESVRLGKKFVKVGDADFVALADGLRARLRPLAAFSNDEAAGGEVQVAPSAALALDDLREAGARFDESQVWLELRARAERARAVDDEPPAGLQARLRPYQRQGLLFLRRLAAWGTGGVLADDMGLGKTLQAIALLIDRRALGPQLVVAPTSVCFNWERELARFAPSLRPTTLGSAERAPAVVAAAGPADVVIASYGVAVLAGEALAAKRFATLVLDEAQAVKNADTQRAKMARDLDAEWKIALSGTPLENHLGELWSIFRVVSPGLLGGAESFKKRFALPIERDGSRQKRAELAQTLRPFLLRRTRDEVLPDLPARTEVVVPVELDAAERALYDATRAAVLLDVGAELEGASNDRRFRVLAGLTRLRLLCCHRAFASDVADPAALEPSSKHAAVLHALEAARENGHRALVFSQFVRHLDVVEALLAKAGLTTLRLDGSTPAAERARRVDAFQAGAADAFLISLKAGGAGLNLTAADLVLHLDPWWNPAVEDQATARAHRIGRQKPVAVYRFVARGTIEEQMIAMHEEKRDLVDGVLEGADAAGRLSLDELVGLLRT